MYVDRRLTLAGLQTVVVTLEAGSTARLGIYSFTSLVPDALVVDYGTIDSSTTGIKEATGSTVLDPGWYALAIWCSNHSTVRYARPTFALTQILGGTLGTSTNGNAFWKGSGALDYSGGLPANATSLSAENPSVQRPMIAARFS
jgi:hypothetical protein